MSDKAVVKALRDVNTKNAIVFVHGFGGDPSGTWGEFPEILMAEPALSDWDVFSVGYLSKLAPDFKGIWEGNPSVSTIASYLNTIATDGELRDYEAFALIAHSMGGLVVQRALLDYKDLLDRTSHVFFFGSPSDGLKKVGFFHWFKRQVDDLDANGDFIQKLKADREKLWPKSPPPHFWAVAGDADEFVPAWTSLGPYPNEQRRVVSGNHLEIVKPQSKDDLSVQIVVQGIRGEAASGGLWNAARVALQMLDFRRAVRNLEKNAAELDDAHLVELALALESLGERDKAREVLEKSPYKGTDAMGVLAGRLKRRWIAGGRKADYERAFDLYTAAYEESVNNSRHDQAFYHGINICFLAIAGPDKGSVDVTGMAQKVLFHCEQVPQDFWSLGTTGEAKLCLGDTEGALKAYREAAQVDSAKPRQLQSMHSQASQLAAILDRDELIDDLNQIFRQE